MVPSTGPRAGVTPGAFATELTLAEVASLGGETVAARYEGGSLGYINAVLIILSGEIFFPFHTISEIFIGETDLLGADEQREHQYGDSPHIARQGSNIRENSRPPSPSV